MRIQHTPQAIEAQSFAIIDAEIGEHNFPEDEWTIVRRVIHATADFDFAKTIRFHPEAIVSSLKALLNGCHIITDVRMVKVGISKALLGRFGGSVKCFISHPDVAEKAKHLGLTRSIVAMRKALPYVNGGIAVIGNAPTALFEMIRLVQSGVAKPLLIVGVPVGFVAAEESKSALLKLGGIPFITNEGRKGGSAVAVAITNALLQLAIAKREEK
ncbi:TPA: precorrin-8X methylmutase [Candidatus Poribacteria bacterium]|nr:precorrin-8X methylmutase [Candidatus Poribacteria bacterium]